MDTPIYSAEGPEADMGYYEDIADLIHNAQRLLRDYISYDDVDKQYQPVAHPANNVEAISQVAQALFDGVTWQSYDSYIPDVGNDIEENPDIYDKIFIKQYWKKEPTMPKTIYTVIEEDIDLDNLTVETYTDAFQNQQAAQNFLQNGYDDIIMSLQDDHININLQNNDHSQQADIATDHQHYHFEIQTTTIHD